MFIKYSGEHYKSFLYFRISQV